VKSRIESIIELLVKIRQSLRSARGRLVTIRLTEYSSDLSAINSVRLLFNMLARLGLVDTVRKRSSTLYVVYRDSPAYKLLTESSLDCLLNLIFYSQLLGRVLERDEVELMVKRCLPSL